MKKIQFTTALLSAKASFFLLPLFVWLQACSQSPAPNAEEKPAYSILNDSSGVALGDSPNREYRLFKFAGKTGETTETILKVLRLKDLQETTVATLRTDPKFYWSSDSRYLITENSVPDSIYQREVVVFNLKNFEMERRKQGILLNYDLLNDVAFLYRYTEERQIICFFYPKSANMEQYREILVPQDGKVPSMILSPKERKAKVKAYTTGGVPMNVAFQY